MPAVWLFMRANFIRMLRAAAREAKDCAVSTGIFASSAYGFRHAWRRRTKRRNVLFIDVTSSHAEYSLNDPAAPQHYLLM